MSKRLSGPSLMLMELTLVSLIFCVCAAVCTMMFARSVRVSSHSAALTGAVFAAESAAEAFKRAESPEQLAILLEGELNDGVLTVRYDEDWSREGELIYTLFVVVGERENSLQRAQIWVADADQELFTLHAARYTGGGA